MNEDLSDKNHNLADNLQSRYEHGGKLILTIDLNGNGELNAVGNYVLVSMGKKEPIPDFVPELLLRVWCGYKYHKRPTK
jgi:hypothetical protein